MTDKKQIYAALAKAKAQFKTIEKRRIADAGSYSYKYANLADCIDAVTDGLSENGLAFLQEVTHDGKHIKTTITHESGQSIPTLYPIIAAPAPSKRDPIQEYQATFEKVRRYGLCAALGVSSEETIDGAPPKKESLSRQAKEDAAADVLLNEGPEKLADQLIEKIESYKDLRFLKAYWSNGNGPGYMVLTNAVGEDDPIAKRVRKAHAEHKEYLELPKDKRQ